MSIQNKIIESHDTQVDELLYDWNRIATKDFFPSRKKPIEINDETLRDGLQGTYVLHPPLENKIRLIDDMEKLGIDSVNIGFPISGTEATSDIIQIIKHAQKNRYSISLECGGRILKQDIEAIIDVSQKTGQKVGAGLFIGSSKMRHLVEKWDLVEMAIIIRESISLAVKNGLSVMFVSEDTSRSYPDTISYLYSVAIDAGATRICVCDTVGFANPWATFQLVSYVKNQIVKNQDIAIDWHGHNDRGLAVANSLAAAYAGADRIQATALGIGERAGNASMAELLINLEVDGLVHKNLTYLPQYITTASEIVGIPIRAYDPVIGSDVFKTATGVHAAAIKKAFEMDNKQLAGIIYSSIDPYILGREHEILIGPMSGRSNVLWVLQKMSVEPSDDLIGYILNEAKKRRKILNRKEVQGIISEYSPDKAY